MVFNKKKLKKGAYIVLVMMITVSSLGGFKSFADTDVILKKEDGVNNFIYRDYGEDRYKTSLNVADTCYNSYEKVFLASGENYVDSLFSTHVASYFESPIVLVKKNTIDKKMYTVFSNHNVKDIVIVGGENSISKNVENNLRNAGYNVERVSGKDRYETAHKINHYMFKYKKIKKTYG